MLKPMLLVYLFLFYGVAFIWPSYRTWKTTGINPYRLNKEEGIRGFLAKIYRLVSIGVAGTILIYVFAGDLYMYLTPIEWLSTRYVMVIGLILLLASFLWIVLAQRQMGSSWRIGIDDEHETELVVKGVFGISRNPIFLGMRLNLAGLFLVLPNAVTLTLWVLGDVSLQMQVLLEEEYLKHLHGDVYVRYLSLVRRWI